MTKRILSLLLAAMMVLGSLVIVSAEEPDYAAENTWAIEVLTKIEVLQGYAEGELGLDDPILRYQMALFIGRALTGETKDANWAMVENETPFNDLLVHPYNGVCTWAFNHGVIFGVDNSTFNPNGNITYQDAIVMIVRAWADYWTLLGLEGSIGIKDELHYPWKHIELADELGLLKNIDPDEVYLEATTRGVVAQLVYNLLTWDDDNYNGYLDSKILDRDSLGKKHFKLDVKLEKAVEVVVDKIDGDKVLVTPEIKNLKTADFTEFNTEAKVGSKYAIKYYTVGDETVVYDIKKISTDAAVFTNTPDAKEYEIIYEACAWNDKGEATAYKVTGIKAGETTYALLGDNKVAVKYYDRTGKLSDAVAASVLEGVDGSDEGTAADGISKADLDAILKFAQPEYSKLTAVDENKDGKVDTLVITPYVFAALYTETAIKDSQATEYKLAGYGVVAVTDAVLTEKATNYYDRTWTGWKVKDKDGKEVVTTITTKTAEYVAKSSVTALAVATKLEAVKLDKYDIRKDVTQYIKFVGDTTNYGYGYASLLAWDIYAGTNGVADYFNIARVDAASGRPLKLLELYNNKNLADDKLVDENNDGVKGQYVNAWVLNGNVVALEYATKSGESGGTGGDTTQPTVKYDGILLVTGVLPEIANVVKGAKDKDDKEIVKIVNGCYYLVTKANVDGVEKDVLVYLAKATTFAFDATAAGDATVQQNNWTASENANIKKGYTAIFNGTQLLSGSSYVNTVVFYEIDDNGNYVLVPNVDVKDTTLGIDVKGVAVNGASYKEHVGDSFVVPALGDKDKGELNKDGKGFVYTMDRNATDFIKYNYTLADDPLTTDDDKLAGSFTRYIEEVASENTTWLFVTKTSISVETGAPEYGSTFTVAAQNAIVKNDDAYVVFDATNKYGFEYSMFAGATYAIYNGETALDYMVRDGYLYFTVAGLLEGENVLICVEETSDLAMKLEELADAKKKVIIAVTENEEHEGAHELLGIYDIKGTAIAAIASLAYGKTAFEDVTGKITTKTDLVERIAEQYNLTEIASAKMTGKILNVAGNDFTEVTGETFVSSNIYVFYTAATADAPASYVAFVVAK